MADETAKDDPFGFDQAKDGNPDAFNLDEIERGTVSNFNAKSFFVADGSFRSLAKSIVAAPGMGKSVWISEMVPDAIKGEPAHRIVYISPKHETFSGKLSDAPIIYSPDDLIPAL
ncbi:uncharacterized protein METZ01_LOCUS338646, partial [marine metagenome]